MKLSWKKCMNLPVAISAPQVVKIGDCVYMGGGMRRDEYKGVYKFDTKQETWTSLPPCPAIQYGLTTLNGELIVIGGQLFNRATNTAYTFRDKKWIEVLPPMPTARCLLSTVSHNNEIVLAAGGTTLVDNIGRAMNTDVVEIYTQENQTWHTTNPLPFPICAFSMCIISDTCYILGGTVNEDECCIALHATIPSLLQTATATSSYQKLVWKQFIDEHPLNLSSVVELNGRLTAMGGSSRIIQRRGTKFISTYSFGNATWVECKGAQLPVPLYRAGVVKLDSDQVMIVGGQPKMQQFSAAVYIGRCYKARKRSYICS